MAQNISLLGANYANVPAVDLPKTGGGTARFDDTTDATAIASDILLGKTAYVNGEKITGTNQGGSEDGSVWKDNEGFVVLDDQPGVNVTVEPLSVTANGTYTAPTGTAYSPVSVDVTLTPNLQNKSVGPTESQQTVTADNGYDGLGTVTVGAISSTYVGTGITRRSSSDLTASGATVSVPSGYYQNSESKTVASGTAGTPTATKSAVSNHSVTVTPSVTNTTGYITGSTETGTAVSVSASELVSGSQNITTNNTYDVTNLSSVVVNVSGGGGGPVAEKQVNFIDYDGTILYSYTKEEVVALDSLPTNPSHTGLTAQGWNWTLAQIKTQLTYVPNGPVWVGQMYVTTSGDTEIDVVMPEGRLSPILTIAVNGSVTVDWGDNTATDTITGTSLTTRKEKQHTYTESGNYTITIHVVSGSFQFYGSSSYLLLRKGTNSSENYVYGGCVKSLRFGNSVTSIGSGALYYCTSLVSVTLPSSITSIAADAFRGCRSLESITIPSSVNTINSSTFSDCHAITKVSIPSSVTSISGSAFATCVSLSSITIPSSVTSIGNSVFNACYNLKIAVIPSGVESIGSNTFYNCRTLAITTIPSSVTSIGGAAFQYCYSLQSLTIPNGVESIGNNAFHSCYIISSITIPSSVTSIGNSSFNSLYGVQDIHVKPATPPTLGTTAFTNIAGDCVIYVPSASLANYQTDTSWSAYASYMQGE